MTHVIEIADARDLLSKSKLARVRERGEKQAGDSEIQGEPYIKR
jgi:hypothetical protein